MSFHISKKIAEIDLEPNTSFVDALFFLQDIISEDSDSKNNNKLCLIFDNFSQKMKSLECCKDFEQDAIFILLYSSILLYNDIFDIKIKKKITLQQFFKMLKGCNSSKDFPEEFLKSIYELINAKMDKQLDEKIEKNNKKSFCVIL